MRRLVQKIESAASGILEVLLRTLLAAITLIVAWQVFGRYVLKSTPSWAEELALVLMIWFGMLGAALGARERVHLRVELFVRALGDRPRRAFEAGADLLVLLFGLVMIVSGVSNARFNMDHYYTVIRIPVGWAYLAIPVSGALVCFYTLLNLSGLAAPGADETREN